MSDVTDTNIIDWHAFAILHSVQLTCSDMFYTSFTQTKIMSAVPTPVIPAADFHNMTHDSWILTRSRPGNRCPKRLILY